MRVCERCGQHLTSSDVLWQTGEWLCVRCKAIWVRLMPAKDVASETGNGLVSKKTTCLRGQDGADYA